MKPRDGPAAIAATDGHWIIAGLDRNWLRPLRYTITKSDLSIVGSAIGMVQLDVIGDRLDCVGLDNVIDNGDALGPIPEEVGGNKIVSNTVAWSDTDSLMRMLRHRVKQHFLLLYGEAEGLPRPRACGKAGLPELGWHDAPRDAITP